MFVTSSACLAAAWHSAAVAAARLLSASAAASPWALFAYALAGATPLSRLLFCSARSVALNPAHICATAGSLCHSRIAREKRWYLLMVLDAAVSVFPSEYGCLALSVMKRQLSMPLK